MEVIGRAEKVWQERLDMVKVGQAQYDMAGTVGLGGMRRCMAGVVKSGNARRSKTRHRVTEATHMFQTTSVLPLFFAGQPFVEIR